MRVQRKFLGLKCGMALAMMAACGGANAAHFIYTGGHPLDDGRIAALGHTYTYACFPADEDDRGKAAPGTSTPQFTEECWLAVLNGEFGSFNAIAFGENGSVPNETVAAAIRAYLNGGGKVIGIDDHNGQTDFYNDTLLLSTFAAYTCREDDSIAGTITAAVAGTSFAIGPNEVRNASCTSGLATSSLPAGAKTFYAGESIPEAPKPATSSPQVISVATSLVWANAYGTGTLIGLGWDYCCADSEKTTDDWYIVLDNALKYSAAPPPGSANLRLSFSGPSTAVRSGNTVAVYARLDNYGRNNAVNPVVRITASLPTANVALASDPPGWLCTGDEQPDRPGSSKTALVGEVDITCRMAGSLPRTTVLFKLNVVPTTSGDGFHTFNGTASSDSVDPVPGNNSAAYKLYVRPSGSVSPVAPPRT